MAEPQTETDPKENLPLGSAFALLAFLCLASMSAFAKMASEDVPVIVIVFFQNLICLIFVAPFALRHGLAPLKTKRFGMQLLRGISGVGVSYGQFLALTFMPLSNAVLLTYSGPLWMPLIAWLVSREKISGRLWLGMVLGFVGIILTLHPSGASFNVGAVFALGAAIAVALSLLSIRWMSTTEPTERILFYYFLIASLLTAPFALASWTDISLTVWVTMIAVGLSLLGSQVFVVIALRNASAVALGPLVYSVIVFSAIIQWLFWAHTPSLLEIAGMVLVILGGVIAVVRWGSRHAAAESPQ
jgi:drug/metabolite transporter (DMT)-like permease